MYTWKHDGAFIPQPCKPFPQTYGEYSLDGIPVKARPQQDRVNRGNHSYTVSVDVPNADGELEQVLIDVLLRQKAYFIKKCPGEGKKGQVSWKKNGGPGNAWVTALEQARAGGA